MHTDINPTMEDSKFVSRGWKIAFALIASVFVLFVSLPTVVWLLTGPGSIFEERARHIVSPDGRFEINIFRRVSLPVFDPSAPASKIRLELREVGSPAALNSVEFEIHEFQELMHPAVMWNDLEVYIDEIESHGDFSLRLKLPTRID
jgi:hypothetical protein